jgi:hypothetical protein
VLFVFLGGNDNGKSFTRHCGKFAGVADTKQISIRKLDEG